MAQLNQNNSGFAFIFGSMSAQEYAARNNSVNDIAIEALREAVDYLGSTKVNQFTPLERSRQQVLRTIRENKQNLDRMIGELDQMDRTISQTWTEYQASLKNRNQIMQAREVAKSRKQDISEFDSQLQDEFKTVGALLDKVNALKAERNEKQVIFQGLKRLISRQKKTLDNPAELVSAQA